MYGCQPSRLRSSGIRGMMFWMLIAVCMRASKRGSIPVLWGPIRISYASWDRLAYYKPVFTKDVIWANSIRLGLEQAFAGALIPLSESFFSGGGSTLRGFPLNGAGPQRAVQVCGIPGDQSTCGQISVPLGGPQLFILNSELRFPTHVIDKLGAVVFYDGGNVFQSLGLGDIGNYSNTVGFGLRYSTPVGPVRLDIGRNLNPIQGVNATQFFITLGQAF